MQRFLNVRHWNNMFLNHLSIRNSFVGLLMIASVGVLAAEDSKFSGVISENIASTACELAKGDDKLRLHSVLIDSKLLNIAESLRIDTPVFYSEIQNIRCEHTTNSEGVPILHYALIHKSVNTIEWVILGLGNDYNLPLVYGEYKTILDWLDFLDDPNVPSDYDQLIEKYRALGARRCAEIPECAVLE